MRVLKESIQKVIGSYEKPHTDDEVFVQPMLENVIRSGVAFSHDPNTCSPYRVINWKMTFMEQRKRYRKEYEKVVNDKLETKFNALSKEEQDKLMEDLEKNI